jgi:AraC-like DNA-binding protein
MQHVLPAAEFTTEALPARGRYEAWRNLVSAVFEPRPAEADRVDIRAHASSVHLGRALVVHAIAEAQYFTRTKRLITTEGLDHYLIQVYRHGVCDGTYGKVQNTVRPGDVKVIDLGRPFSTFNTDFDNITLTIPRSALAPLVAHPDGLHGTVLARETGMAKVLASHIRQLAACADGLNPAEGAALGAASVRLVAACLGANPRARDETRPYRAAAIGQCVRDFIDRNLASPRLEPATLAQHFHMSRAQLYRLFPGEGGVAAYIRSRRLRACFLAITDPMHGAEAIGEIALNLGFGSEAHFSRAFRTAFGISPSEARAARPTPGIATSPGTSTFINDWMRGLALGVGDYPGAA